MRWILDMLFGRRLAEHTARYLDELRATPTLASHAQSAALVKALAQAGSAILIGKTPAGESVSIPMSDVLKSFAMVTGGTGAGKTRFGLIILKSLIDQLPQTRAMGCCVLDPKGETFAGALYLLKQRMAELGKNEARELRRRVVLIDFSQRDPLSSYNILRRWADADSDFFAGNRADLLLDLLPGGDALSLGGSGLLRKAILLLSEFGLPIGWLDGVLFDDALRAKLLAKSTDKDVIAYFKQQFPNAPKQTAAALSRRMEALFSSDALRSTLSGPTAPDFRALQDEGKIVLINCAGPNLSRGVRRVLQALLVSDFCHAVFARKHTDSPFLLLADEGQNCFITERLRDQMADFFCTARSFGTHAILLTQAMGAALRDPRLASVLHTNIRWSFSMRGEPSDAAYLKGALPVTGRKRRPQVDPFAEPSYYSLNEERSLVLDGIANLPDRTGYFWLKSRSAEAFLVRTQDIAVPAAGDLEREIQSLRNDPTFGMRQSRKDFDRVVAQREEEWRSEPPSDLSEGLAGAYRRGRGATS